jgi:hypothetical protein
MFLSRRRMLGLCVHQVLAQVLASVPTPVSEPPRSALSAGPALCAHLNAHGFDLLDWLDVTRVWTSALYVTTCPLPLALYLIDTLLLKGAHRCRLTPLSLSFSLFLSLSVSLSLSLSFFLLYLSLFIFS